MRLLRHRADHRLAAALSTAAVAGLLACPVAGAQELPDDNSALDQYVASLPEPGGKRPAGRDDGPGKGLPLPPVVNRQLASAEDGDALREVATSPALGAPAAGGGGIVDGRGTAAIIRPVSDDTGPGMLSAVAGTTAGSPVGAVLLALLLAGGGAAIALRRRREEQG
jgi:hypothetical protein